jgi:hypothetical protein
MEEKKELVWLPKLLADKILAYQEKGEDYQEMIDKYIKDIKGYLLEDIKAMDDEMLVYQASMVKAKNKFKEVKEEQLNGFYSLWEKFEEDVSKFRDFTTNSIKELEPLKESLKEINNLIDKISTWQVNDFLETLQKINTIIDSENKTSEMVKFLFNNYKK